MRHGLRVSVIIPACNEAASIKKVIETIPVWVDQVVVADNASTDETGLLARTAGATVVHEPQRGYGAACLKAIVALDAPDIVVFLDGDFSDYPEDMEDLVDPIAAGSADMVIGSRGIGPVEPGALTPQQRYGNQLACFLIRWIWGFRYTDLGPFRAIGYAPLMELEMRDRTWGWTVEMQIKALKHGLRVREVAVRYRKRIGVSKISGTVQGVLRAGAKILYTIGREAVRGGLDGAPAQRLILFTKFPMAGQVKTRLIPALGEAGATAVHKAMTEHAAIVARRSRIDEATHIEVRFTGATRAAMREWLGPDLDYAAQGDGDLGARMLAAIEDARTDFERIVVIGSDCPALDDAHVRKAFALLRHNDVVIGPAEDGGYYLIGLRHPAPELFEGIAWSTDRVFDRTRAKAERLGLRVALLPTLPDVDRPQDLEHWERVAPIPSTDAPPRLSVIIPALNEETLLARTLASVRTAPGCEILVADGGSDDGTVRLAETYGARVLRCERGRARQMNAAAAHATGRYLLFLHADTVLPPQFEETVETLLGRPGAAGGAFRLRVDGRGLTLRLAERIANVRSAWRQLPYGDQAIFVNADVFRAEGGFRPMPIMEDFELMTRLRRRGSIVLADDAVRTSARRWTETGPLRLTLRHQWIILGWKWGVSPERLARWR